jgi:hypothetical protein
MVKRSRQDIEKKPAKQAPDAVIPEATKIGASTPYDFEAKNLTAYGGLLPVATMLEKLGFQQVVEEMVTVTRVTRSMPAYQFVLAMVLVIYVGFSRLNHLRFVQREPCRFFLENSLFLGIPGRTPMQSGKASRAENVPLFPRIWFDPVRPAQPVASSPVRSDGRISRLRCGKCAA